MGQPAAALGDIAAHGGTIAIGSPNVFIGSRPAARKGDSVLCALHGTGVIAMGSATVLINGMAAARMLDITGCLVPGMAVANVPPVLGLPPKTKARSLDRAKDGKTHAENDAADGISGAHAEYTQSDADQDGVMDTHTISAEMLRVRKEKVIDNGNGKTVTVAGSLDMFYTNAQVSKASTIMAVDTYNAEVGVARGSISLSEGDTGSKSPDGALTAEGTFLYAKVEREAFFGNNKRGKIGVYAKGGASGQVFGLELGELKKSPTIAGYNATVKIKRALAFGGFGGGAGAWGYLDTVEERVHLGISALFKVVLGGEYEFDLSVGKVIPGIPAGGIPGTIMVGNPRVLIG